MFAIAFGRLISQEVILRKPARLDPFRHLHFARIETAIGGTRLGVVATNVGNHAGIAGNVVQTVARIVGPLDQLDRLNVERENHVQIGHVSVITITGNAVDQQLDGIDFPFAIKGAERKLAGGRSLLELGQHDARQHVEELPTILHVLALEHVTAQNID